MSRIGNKSVPIPAGVEVAVGASAFEVKGPKGSLSFPLFREVTVSVAAGQAVVAPTGAGAPRQASAYQGLVRAHLANMVRGVTEGYSKSLEIVGTGWSAKPKGAGVELVIGYCHPVECQPPAGVKVAVTSPTELVVSGIDRQAVGQFAANLRRVRPPEPFKGKGIRYKGEEVRRKAGKAMA